jgi:hypothetical protein
MQNYEQMRLIMDWERDNFGLGIHYKNRLAKKSVVEVKNELTKLTNKYKGVTLSVKKEKSKRNNNLIRFK